MASEKRKSDMGKYTCRLDEQYDEKKVHQLMHATFTKFGTRGPLWVFTDVVVVTIYIYIYIYIW